jgi:hypothetical protein
VHPAWLACEKNDNGYNAETRRLLKIFTDMGIGVNKGNDIFAAGNALKYLSEYFPPPDKVDLTIPCGTASYTSRLDEVESVSINPNGDVIVCSPIGNIYRNDIIEIVENYDPFENPVLRSILDGGVEGLARYAEKQGVTADISGCRSACNVCKKIMTALLYT